MTVTKETWAAGAWAFLRNVAAVVVALGAIWAGGAQVAGPAVDAWLSARVGALIDPLVGRVEANAAAIEADRRARELDARAQRDMRETLASIAETQKQMAETLSGAVDRLAELEEKRSVDTSAVMRFARTGHRIEDGAPGDSVEVTWSVIKLRDGCGRPLVELFFRNGGGRLHRFRNVSALDDEGRGIGLPAGAGIQTITYTAQIPADDGVEPGRGFGWNRVSYPNCPGVGYETSPEVVFQILPPRR